MDGVILIAVVVPAIIGLFSLMVQTVSTDGGTKGITPKPYKTKSGAVHTAHKSREQHIV